jgi:O-antigen ligase
MDLTFMDALVIDNSSSRTPDWPARFGTALVMTIAFWFVVHSFTESRRIVQEGELGAGRTQNQYAVQQKETTATSVIGYFMIGGMGAFLWWRSAPRQFHWQHWLVWCGLAFIAWNFISILWSIEAMQSFRKLAILGLMVVGGLGLAKRFEMEDLIWISILSITAFVLAGVLAELALGTFRPWRHDYRFAGTCHPNDQGLQCALLVIAAGFAEFVERDRPWLRRALIALGLVGLAMSKSRTTLVAFMAAMALALILRSRGVQRWIVTGGCIAVLCLAGILSSFVSVSAANEAGNLAAMGRKQHLSSLTGRLPLWQELWKAAEDRLWLGHGMGAFWNGKSVTKYSRMFGWHIPHAHNAYLDLILQMGLIGMAMHVVWLIGTGVVALHRYDRWLRPADLFVTCFMAFEVVHGISESKLPGSGEAGFLMLAVVMMVALQLPKTGAVAASARDATLTWRNARAWRQPRRRAISGNQLGGALGSEA